MSKKVNWSKRVHVGDKFGGLTVMELPDELNSQAQIRCQCECSNECFVPLGDLLSHRACTCDYLQDDNSIFNGDESNENWRIVELFKLMHHRAKFGH